jgi:hypothetical protein
MVTRIPLQIGAAVVERGDSGLMGRWRWSLMIDVRVWAVGGGGAGEENRSIEEVGGSRGQVVGGSAPGCHLSPGRQAGEAGGAACQEGGGDVLSEEDR